MKDQEKAAEFAPEYQEHIKKEEYGGREEIEGVRIVEIEKNFVAEDGRFVEICRLNEEGELIDLPGLKLRQLNYVEVLPGAKKAWHIHERQDEALFIHPDSRMIIGLMDIREGSATKGNKIRLILGGGKTHLLFIPKGVAHGMANPYQELATLTYLVDQYFDGSDADEYRLPFDFEVGEDFWKIRAG